MTETDRLHQAADALDQDPLLRWATTVGDDGYPAVATVHVPEVATLLRAVADDLHLYSDWHAETVTTALSLADTILGDTGG